MTRRPEREWDDPPMPDDSPLSLKKILGYFTVRGIAISLGFMWSIWAMYMVREWMIWDDVTPLLLAETFIIITVYAILISPITEWSWNVIKGGK